MTVGQNVEWANYIRANGIATQSTMADFWQRLSPDYAHSLFIPFGLEGFETLCQMVQVVPSGVGPPGWPKFTNNEQGILWC